MSPKAQIPPSALVRPIMPELDTLRGIAILLVIVFHGFDVPGALVKLSGPARWFVFAATGGWTGVYLFFVLSGFLISGILLDSKTKPNYYKRFYVRRALRILPAFYLLLLLLCVLPRTGWLEGRQVGWPFITLSFFYLSNVTTLFGVPAQYAALWSLAVEEHFYLVWPTVIRALSAKAAAWTALAVFIACPIIRATAYWMGWNYGAGYTWLVADGLAIGALVGILSRGRLSDRSQMRRFSFFCLTLATALLIFGAPFGIWRGSRFLGGVVRLTAVEIFCAGLLGATLLMGTSRFRTVVRRPLLQWFGGISYGLYLIQMLVFDFVNHCMSRLIPNFFEQLPSHFGLIVVRFALALGIAVAASFVSRRYFENWFLGLKDRLTPSSPSQTVVSSVLDREQELQGRIA